MHTQPCCAHEQFLRECVGQASEQVSAHMLASLALPWCLVVLATSPVRKSPRFAALAALTWSARALRSAASFCLAARLAVSLSSLGASGGSSPCAAAWALYMGITMLPALASAQAMTE